MACGRSRSLGPAFASKQAGCARPACRVQQPGAAPLTCQLVVVDVTVLLKVERPAAGAAAHRGEAELRQWLGEAALAVGRVRACRGKLTSPCADSQMIWLWLAVQSCTAPDAATSRFPSIAAVPPPVQRTATIATTKPIIVIAELFVPSGVHASPRGSLFSALQT